MSWPGAVPAWVWWLIVLALVAGGQQYRVVVAQGETSTARGELADYSLQVAERDRRAAAQARTEEHRRQAVTDEADRKADERYANLEGRVVAAESRSVGLRGEIERLRASHRATCDTIAAQQRQAGASAVVVLGGLLEESDRMAGDLAKALERSRIAGLACEAVADGIRRGGE
ncbi:DUF2514 family protein [Pseudomonas sp. NY15354]|uniref:DUF2514 family protein n=1 Tax=Pseudomonas sp. NY15354 TaxID=3400351 RepID=UPI003A8BD13D